ncbi:MAG TPA: aminotransferase class I/II-fold pyridoxal phosphate-dependent enzyme [Candidatus Acutalibacter pullistercoris]|uniref:Aminotransferase class I/II-fold pyridoxal phosphate-dependent enzyme n=1 Tax=Candidatus Acutalibacter pullistercoris TaxID=2838418 RepID=A0A9D1YCS9_9FIRM|nr:aminotransferase class I/II-fold pyridoxal phosphate-dependent enzyme [Candidatus Acutalibacter pullistercoris]
MKLAAMETAQLRQLNQETAKRYEDFKALNLQLNMARGKPCADQLDLALGVLEALKARSEFANSNGDDSRNYGIWNGLPEMREIFSHMIGLPADQIILGNNSSLQMMYDCISQGTTHGWGGCKPWGRQENIKFLCPVPGYDRHFAVTEYFGIEMIPVPMLKTGPDMDMIERLVEKDESVKGCWCVPKYSNPTGVTYSDETVRRFAALKPAAKDFRIMWDNAYCVHDLTDTPDTLLNLYEECLKQGTEDNVLYFASTSKISFPGAGVAALGASPRNIIDLKKRITTQTIGPDKLNQLRHILFLHDIDGVYSLMQGHRKILEPKFHIVQESLERELGGLGVAQWSKPNGGYFVNLDVMNGCAKRVVDLCKSAGVVLTDAGATFPYGQDPNDSNIRIAPTFPPQEELAQAMHLLCICVVLAATEKLLADRL